jgi:hypothetical protein
MTQKSMTDDGWIDSTTYSAGVTIERGKQRHYLLTGEKEKTRGLKAWSHKQKVKADRQEVQLETQQVRLQEDRTKLQIAQDDRDFINIYQPLHRVDLAQRLVKKTYKIGANSSTLSGQIKGSLSASTEPVISFANRHKEKTSK